jgi:hypothetical protein
LEASFSHGPSVEFDFSICVDTCNRPGQAKPEPVSWGQIELGWEQRAVSGFSLRTSVGLAAPISEPTWQCQSDKADGDCDGIRSDEIFVLSVALGYAFDLR